MNIILFSTQDRKTSDDENGEVQFFFNNKDERYFHITKVLHLGVDDVFKCGLINGDVGRGKIKELTSSYLLFEFTKLGEPTPLYPINLILGIPRPIQLKRILKDVATMGVASIHLIGTVLGEKSYINSSLIEKQNIQKYLIEGASQSGSSLVPPYHIYHSLRHFLESKNAPKEEDVKLLFDIKDGIECNKQSTLKLNSIWCAIGSERGWVEEERALFYTSNFVPIQLGKRILRTETATIAILSFILTASGAYAF